MTMRGNAKRNGHFMESIGRLQTIVHRWSDGHLFMVCGPSVPCPIVRWLFIK